MNIILKYIFNTIYIPKYIFILLKKYLSYHKAI